MSLPSSMSVPVKPLSRICKVSAKAMATTATLPTISTSFLPMGFQSRRDPSAGSAMLRDGGLLLQIGFERRHVPAENLG
jgi:hypothetical protein